MPCVPLAQMGLVWGKRWDRLYSGIAGGIAGRCNLRPHRSFLAVFVALIVVLVTGVAAACGPSSSGLTPLPSPTPPPPTVASTPTATAKPQPTPTPRAATSPVSTVVPRATLAPPVLRAAGEVRLEIAPGTVARYLVREQLAGVSLPNDAVGTTTAVKGQVLLGPGNTVQGDESRFTVDLTTLKSDDSRRDNYIRRNTLDTGRFPTAGFVLREVRGLASPLPESGAANFQLEGDLTVRGVTSSVVWNAAGTFILEGIIGTATTSFPFSQFGMRAPAVFVVVSVEDNIRLELDFQLVRSG